MSNRLPWPLGAVVIVELSLGMWVLAALAGRLILAGAG